LQPLVDAALLNRADLVASLSMAWGAYIGHVATPSGGQQGSSPLVDQAEQASARVLA
jgi:hypothetical protein